MPVETSLSSQLSRTPDSVTIARDGSLREASGAKKSGGFSFGDLIDVINPLHHIPVVGTIYRAVTGDNIKPEARIAGGGLFFGPIGAGIGAASWAAEEVAPKALDTMARKPEGQRADERAQLAPRGGPAGGNPFLALPMVKGDAAMPQLSPQAFQALMTSLSPETAAGLDARRDEIVEKGPGAVPAGEVDAEPLGEPAAAIGGDLAALMEANLKKYQDFKIGAEREREEAER